MRPKSARPRRNFLQALAEGNARTKTFDSLTDGVKSGAISQAQYRMAEAALSEARIRLASARQGLVNLGLPVRSEDFQGLSAEEISRRVQFLGLPEAVVKTFEVHTVTANLLSVVSPLDGVVVERGATAGEVVNSSELLVRCGGRSATWASRSTSAWRTSLSSRRAEPSVSSRRLFGEGRPHGNDLLGQHGRG